MKKMKNVIMALSIAAAFAIALLPTTPVHSTSSQSYSTMGFGEGS